MWKEIFDDFIICLFKRDPCKNCIIRPCCSRRCDQYGKFKRAISSTPVLQRTTAWLLFLVIFVEIPWIIIGLIFKF